MKPDNRLFPLIKVRGFETYLASDYWQGIKIADAISDRLTLGGIL